jgi:hypothetical protein
VNHFWQNYPHGITANSEGREKMKPSRENATLVLCAVVLICIAAVGIALAGADKITVKGTIEQTDTGLFLVAEDDRYAVAGENLLPMVGKTVQVTGTVSEGEAIKLIHLMSVKEVK